MALHGHEGGAAKGLLGGQATGPRGVAPEVGYQGEANVSKKEQAAYDLFMDNGFKLIYDESTMPQLLQRIAQGGNPVEGLATVTVGIVRRLMDAAERAGRKIDPTVLFHGGADLMGDIAELAKTAGVHDFTEEEIENAALTAMDQFGMQEVERGSFDEKAVADDFKTMMDADKAGTLGELLPGVDELQQPGAGPVRRA